MKKKYLDIKEEKVYQKNFQNLKEKGLFDTETGVSYITWDYEINEVYEQPIKKSRIIYNDKLELNEQEEQYLSHQRSEIYKAIKYQDILYGDWWRIGNENEMKYITISTPHLFDINNPINLDLKHLISSHYHHFFGYELDIDTRFVRIKSGNHKGNYELKQVRNGKSSDDLIYDYIKENLDTCDILKSYIDFMKERNEKSLTLKDITLYQPSHNIDKYGYNILVPFFCEKNYKELFKEIIIDNKYPIKEISEVELFLEDCIFDNYFRDKERYKNFLKSFIPDFFNRKFKVKKRKFKKR